MAKIHHGGSVEGLIPNQTVHDFTLQRLAQYGNDIVLTNATTRRDYTGNDLVTMTRRLIQGLQKHDVKKGDVLTIYAVNSAEFLTMVLAGLTAGMTINTCNPAATAYELRHYFQMTEPKIIFTENDMLKNVETAREVLKYKPVVILRQPTIGYINFEQLCSETDDVTRATVTKFDVQNDVAFILFSSGTTGLPKGVMLTHYNVVSHVVLYPTKDPDIRRSTRVLNIFPLYHAAGLFGSFYTVSLGVRKIILEKYNLKLLLESIQHYKVTQLVIPPSVIVQLAKTPLLEQYDVSSVQEGGTGAAPVKSETEQRFKSRFSNMPISNGYGMTEAVAGVVYKTTDVEDQNHPGSSGKPGPGASFKIVDPDSGQLLGPHQRGELHIQSPRVMKGYLNNPKATRETIDDDGWLHTGDVAYYDEDGYFYIVDRLKELIKYKGNQVAPAELEALLLEHSDVDDVGVVGIPDTDAGELPRAYIVPRNGSGLTEQAVMGYVNERVSPYKRLRGGVVFLQEIPKLASGKILRRKLRELTATKKSKL